jgi:hypothetical protein
MTTFYIRAILMKGSNKIPLVAALITFFSFEKESFEFRGGGAATHGLSVADSGR